MGESDVCAVCSVPCSKYCSVCKKVFYCSTEHQKSHRKAHKRDCFPTKLARDEVQGRYFVATKTIKPGERVFAEKALVVGPTGAEKYLHKICLGCYRVVSSDYKCSRCSWPVCNEVCENLPPHCESECKVFAQAKVTPYFTKPYEYDFIKFLRTLLLRDTEPQKWDQVLQLASHREVRRGCEQAVAATAASYDFVTNVCLLNNFNYDELDHVVGVWGVNSFGANAPSGPNPTGRLASFLFPKTSLCSHNCVANTRGILTEETEIVQLPGSTKGRKPVYAMELLASQPIAEGSPILITYAEVGEGTAERQKILQEHYYFSCTCARCKDPTELGTYFSAFKCRSCPDGYLLPKNPLDPETPWKCVQETAGGQISNGSAHNMANGHCDLANGKNSKCPELKYPMLIAPLFRIKQELNSIGMNDTQGEIQRLEKIIIDHSGKTLHRNHWLLMETEYRLMQRLICFMPQAKNVTSLIRRCIAYSEHCLAVADVIRPGYNVYRGKILYCLCQARLQDIVRSDNQDVIEKLAVLNKVRMYAHEAREILAREPDGTDEKTLANALQEDIKQIHRLIGVLDAKLKNNVGL